MLSLFSRYGGYIRAYKIESFWKKLTESERATVKDAFNKSLYPNSVEMTFIDTKGIKEEPVVSLFSFLYGSAVKLYQQKEFDLAANVLTFASKKIKEPFALHQIYNLLIDTYYKQRDVNPNAVKQCVAICKKDIKLAPVITKEKQEVPSFKRLAIILESQGDYKGAIEVSKAALNLGIEDGTKSGFQGRIEKLESKINA